MATRYQEIMNTIFSFIVIIFAASEAVLGDYIITHTPRHTLFNAEGNSIDLSEIPKVVLSSFGFAANHDLKWNGLSQGNLFKRPKAHVIISAEGIEDGKLNIKESVRYKLNNDIATVNTEPVGDVLQTHIEQGSLFIDFNQYQRVYDLKSVYPKLMKDLPSTFTGLKAILTTGNLGVKMADLGSLNITEDTDVSFVGEIYVLRSIISALSSHSELASDSHPDFYHLKVSGIAELVKTYGQHSQKVQDAVELLQKTIAELTSSFCHLYKDNVVVQVVTYVNDEEVLSRRARSLMANPTPNPLPANSTQDELNVARLYKENYPVMFNIIFWFSVVTIITLFFVSYGMWNIDPGRDSIIYRMTTQRLKREC